MAFSQFLWLFWRLELTYHLRDRIKSANPVPVTSKIKRNYFRLKLIVLEKTLSFFSLPIKCNSHNILTSGEIVKESKPVRFFFKKNVIAYESIRLINKTMNNGFIFFVLSKRTSYGCCSNTFFKCYSAHNAACPV